MIIWKGKEKTDTRIIVYFDNTIYLSNPKMGEVENVIANIKLNKAIPKDFTGIPVRYIREIRCEDGKDFIEILFGADSSEILKIKDEAKRLEIFTHFKANIPNSTFFIDKYSKVRAGRKPLIAIVIVLAIFLWTFYISNGFDQGIEYKVVGNQRSLATVVLGIASLGAKKVILIFGSLFTIATVSFILKARNRKIVHVISLKR